MYIRFRRTWMWPDLKNCPPSLRAWHSYNPSSCRLTPLMINSETFHLKINVINEHKKKKSKFAVFFADKWASVETMPFKKKDLLLFSFGIIRCSFNSFLHENTIIIRLATNNKWFTEMIAKVDFLNDSEISVNSCTNELKRMKNKLDMIQWHDKNCVPQSD